MSSAAEIALSLHRDVVHLTGPEVGPFLHGILTANVLTLGPSTMAHAALLTPQGKIIETMFLTRTDDGMLIDVAAGRGEILLKRLTLYRLRAAIDIALTSDIIVGIGPAPTSAIASAPDPRDAALGLRWLSPSADVPSSAHMDDGVVGNAMLSNAEITHGVPVMGRDFAEAEVFPLDVNLDALHGIDHRKGCFIGQEVASRMFRKGDIRKRSFMVKGDRLHPGASLRAGDDELGVVTSVAARVGIARIRIDRLSTADPDAVLADDCPVTLEKPAYL